MRSPSNFTGHPVHPTLVGIPIGLWIFSFVADVCGLMQLAPGAEAWHQLAYLTLIGGIVGALAAAMPGLIDVMSIDDHTVRRRGLTHMGIHLTVIGLYFANACLRHRDAVDLDLPVLLSAGGLLLLAVSGWLATQILTVDTDPPVRRRVTQ